MGKTVKTGKNGKVLSAKSEAKTQKPCGFWDSLGYAGVCTHVPGATSGGAAAPRHEGVHGKALANNFQHNVAHSKKCIFVLGLAQCNYTTDNKSAWSQHQGRHRDKPNAINPEYASPITVERALLHGRAPPPFVFTLPWQTASSNASAPPTASSSMATSSASAPPPVAPILATLSTLKRKAETQSAETASKKARTGDEPASSSASNTQAASSAAAPVPATASTLSEPKRKTDRMKEATLKARLTEGIARNSSVSTRPWQMTPLVEAVKLVRLLGQDSHLGDLWFADEGLLEQTTIQHTRVRDLCVIFQRIKNVGPWAAENVSAERYGSPREFKQELERFLAACAADDVIGADEDLCKRLQIATELVNDFFLNVDFAKEDTPLWNAITFTESGFSKFVAGRHQAFRRSNKTDKPVELRSYIGALLSAEYRSRKSVEREIVEHELALRSIYAEEIDRMWWQARHDYYVQTNAQELKDIRQQVKAVVRERRDENVWDSEAWRLLEEPVALLEHCVAKGTATLSMLEATNLLAWLVIIEKAEAPAEEDDPTNVHGRVCKEVEAWLAQGLKHNAALKAQGL